MIKLHSVILILTMTFFTLSAECVQLPDASWRNPNWTQVLYPHNSATVFAEVIINGCPATVNDVVSAFVGDECRGRGAIVIQNDKAYSTILVNLANETDTVSFRIYEASSDSVYISTSSQVFSFGQIAGESHYYQISNMPISTIDAPDVSIYPHNNGFRINWAPVNNATRYKVISKNAFDAPDSVVYEITTPYFDGLINSFEKLFRVIAVRDIPPARNNR